MSRGGRGGGRHDLPGYSRSCAVTNMLPSIGGTLLVGTAEDITRYPQNYASYEEMLGAAVDMWVKRSSTVVYFFWPGSVKKMFIIITT